MSVEKPIVTKIIGPARTLDEKAETILSTINWYVLRTDPSYCKNMISIVEQLYDSYQIPTEIKNKIELLKKALEIDS